MIPPYRILSQHASIGAYLEPCGVEHVCHVSKCRPLIPCSHAEMAFLLSINRAILRWHSLPYPCPPPRTDPRGPGPPPFYKLASKFNLTSNYLTQKLNKNKTNKQTNKKNLSQFNIKKQYYFVFFFFFDIWLYLNVLRDNDFVYLSWLIVCSFYIYGCLFGVFYFLFLLIL